MEKQITKNDYLNAKNEFFNNSEGHRWAELWELNKILENNTLDADGETVNTGVGDKVLHKINVLSEKRRNSILSSKSEFTGEGCRFYVSQDGNDQNDGSTPETAWKTLVKLNEVEFSGGDTVLFRRGDIFRGNLKLQNGVTYSAYGTGDKPKLYGSPENGADPQKWSLVDGTDNIWVYATEMTDVGIVIFNDGEEYTEKQLPSYIDGRYTVCNSPDNKPFDFKTELADMETFSDCSKELQNGFPSRNGNGKLYLRCDRGNPAQVFDSIEFNTFGNILNGANCRDVTVDNLCLKYCGSHAVGAGHVKNLTVRNCEIGWIGGSVQLYNQSTGKASRYGNGIEVYGSCDGYYAINNYVYQCYDAGITHQQGSPGCNYEFKDVVYKDNLIEDCIYSFEYFMHKPQNSEFTRLMRNILIENNICRRAGYGFGNQRPENFATHILGWWTAQNKAVNYVVKDNIFDRSTQTIIQIHAEEKNSLPKLENNTYLQITDNYFGRFDFDSKRKNYFTTERFYRQSVCDFIKSIEPTAKIYFVK